MPFILGGLIFAGSLLVAVNLLTLRALWLSENLERSQKIAQTVLLWMIPGFFVVVRHIIHEPVLRGTDDPTSHPYQDFTDVSDGGHHGDGGSGGHF